MPTSSSPLRIALIGEYSSTSETHRQTDAGLLHAAAKLDAKVTAEWLSTAHLSASLLSPFDALWIAPGSPYRDMGRTLAAIRSAREEGKPCLGTCGGFQHMVIEYARNGFGLADAQHAEYDPDASRPVISRLSCSLFGREMRLTLAPGSTVARHYGALEARERYYCNFGIEPAFVPELKKEGPGAFRIVGSDSEGEARVMEIGDHPFFVGTLYVPQSRSTPEEPHPLVVAFVRAALERRR